MAAPTRQLEFHSAGDVVEEIERLRRQGYRATGRWNLTDICEHLRLTIRRGLDGEGKRLPWIVRVTVGRVMVRRILRSGRFPAGVAAPQSLVPAASAVDDDSEVIAQAIAAFREAEAATGPLPPHPLVNRLSVEQWQRLMWIHAAHHLGYLVPPDGSGKPVSGL